MAKAGTFTFAIEGALAEAHDVKTLLTALRREQEAHEFTEQVKDANRRKLDREYEAHAKTRAHVAELEKESCKLEEEIQRKELMWGQGAAASMFDALTASEKKVAKLEEENASQARVIESWEEESKSLAGDDPRLEASKPVDQVAVSQCSCGGIVGLYMRIQDIERDPYVPPCDFRVMCERCLKGGPLRDTAVKAALAWEDMLVGETGKDAETPAEEETVAENDGSLEGVSVGDIYEDGGKDWEVTSVYGHCHVRKPHGWSLNDLAPKNGEEKPAINDPRVRIEELEKELAWLRENSKTGTTLEGIGRYARVRSIANHIGAITPDKTLSWEELLTALEAWRDSEPGDDPRSRIEDAPGTLPVTFRIDGELMTCEVGERSEDKEHRFDVHVLNVGVIVTGCSWSQDWTPGFVTPCGTSIEIAWEECEGVFEYAENPSLHLLKRLHPVVVDAIKSDLELASLNIGTGTKLRDHLRDYREAKRPAPQVPIAELAKINEAREWAGMDAPPYGTVAFSTLWDKQFGQIVSEAQALGLGHLSPREIHAMLRAHIAAAIAVNNGRTEERVDEDGTADQEAGLCVCGANAVSHWSRDDRGDTWRQIFCPGCGVKTGRCPTPSTADKQWQEIQKRLAIAMESGGV